MFQTKLKLYIPSSISAMKIFSKFRDDSKRIKRCNRKTQSSQVDISRCSLLHFELPKRRALSARSIKERISCPTIFPRFYRVMYIEQLPFNRLENRSIECA